MEPERRMESAEKGPQEERTKKPYATPQLIVHGDVEKITGDVGTAGPDGLTGSQLL